MILLKKDLITLAVQGVICRNDKGEAVGTLTPREVVILANKSWIEGIAREGKKNFSGNRDAELLHVNLLVPVKKAFAELHRKSVKKSNRLQAKAQGSTTWHQVGASTFFHHYQRCNAFAGLPSRIGVALG